MRNTPGTSVVSIVSLPYELSPRNSLVRFIENIAASSFSGLPSRSEKSMRMNRTLFLPVVHATGGFCLAIGRRRTAGPSVCSAAMSFLCQSAAAAGVSNVCRSPASDRTV